MVEPPKILLNPKSEKAPYILVYPENIYGLKGFTSSNSDCPVRTIKIVPIEKGSEKDYSEGTSKVKTSELAKSEIEIFVPIIKNIIRLFNGRLLLKPFNVCFVHCIMLSTKLYLIILLKLKQYPSFNKPIVNGQIQTYDAKHLHTSSIYWHYKTRDYHSI